eukprot:INCI4490.1.p1 GENE.INCI4490.1~~INCI4490.1.p1  ORF type:complete len:561 (-),score=138.38 INCI4490.1:250-1701(-)
MGLPGAKGRITASKAPRIVVVGATGAGKSTTLNRLLQPLGKKRDHFFKEGAGAASETDAPHEIQAGFLGDNNCPVHFVDMPGLDDSKGAQEDTRHIREAATFLINRPRPEAHLFVLVVNAQSPRLSGSVRNMMTTFKKVFDVGGSQRFVDYLAIVFTKVQFINFMYEDGDTDGDLLNRQQFDEAFGTEFDGLAKDWAVELAALLGHAGDKAAINGLLNRCMFTDHKMPKRRFETLRDHFGFDVENKLQHLYLHAVRNTLNPFMLGNINREVAAREDELAQQAEEARQEKEAAMQREKEEEALRLKAVAETERIRKEAEEAAAKAKQEAAAILAREKAAAEQRERRQRAEAAEKERRLKAEAAAREEQLRLRAEERARRMEAEHRAREKEAERRARQMEAERRAEAEALRRQNEIERQNALFMQLQRGAGGYGGYGGGGGCGGGGGYGGGGRRGGGGCAHRRTRRWGNRYGRGSKCLDCGAECG